MLYIVDLVVYLIFNILNVSYSEPIYYYLTLLMRRDRGYAILVKFLIYCLIMLIVLKKA